MGFLSEFLDFLKKRKLWWMIPIIVVLVGLAIIIWALSPSNPVAPFIYTIF